MRRIFAVCFALGCGGALLAASAASNGRVARCVGASPCAACSSCRSCAHCKAGGTCGACKREGHAHAPALDVAKTERSDD